MAVLPPELRQRFRDAIASIESSGNYGALGPETNGSRAYGRYQVMGYNVGPWTKQALGRELTPQEFLASPEAQDAVFDHVFGGYVQRFGPSGAAQAWFAGPGSVGGGGNPRDVLGTTVSNYVSRFNNAIGMGSPQAQATGAVQPAKPPPVKQDFNTRAQDALQAAQQYLNFNPTQNAPQGMPAPTVQPQFAPVQGGDPRSALANMERDQRAGVRAQDPRLRGTRREIDQMMQQMLAMQPQTPPPPPQRAAPPLLNGQQLPGGYQSLSTPMPFSPTTPPWVRAPTYGANPGNLPPPVLRR